MLYITQSRIKHISLICSICSRMWTTTTFLNALYLLGNKWQVFGSLIWRYIHVCISSVGVMACGHVHVVAQWPYTCIYISIATRNVYECHSLGHNLLIGYLVISCTCNMFLYPQVYVHGWRWSPSSWILWGAEGKDEETQEKSCSTGNVYRKYSLFIDR